MSYESYLARNAPIIEYTTYTGHFGAIVRFQGTGCERVLKPIEISQSYYGGSHCCRVSSIILPANVRLSVEDTNELRAQTALQELLIRERKAVSKLSPAELSPEQLAYRRFLEEHLTYCPFDKTKHSRYVRREEFQLTE